MVFGDSPRPLFLLLVLLIGLAMGSCATMQPQPAQLPEPQLAGAQTSLQEPRQRPVSVTPTARLARLNLFDRQAQREPYPQEAPAEVIIVEPPAEEPLEEEVAPPALRLVPEGDPLISGSVIRGKRWPMVYNEGLGFAYKPETGIASFYSDCELVATGERYYPDGMTAAHKTLPFGTVVRVTRTDTGHSVVVVINDRGPFIKGRIIDLSRGAARKIDMIRRGVVPCVVEVLAYPLIETMGPKGNG